MSPNINNKSPCLHQDTNKLVNKMDVAITKTSLTGVSTIVTFVCQMFKDRLQPSNENFRVGFNCGLKETQNLIPLQGSQLLYRNGSFGNPAKYSCSPNFEVQNDTVYNCRRCFGNEINLTNNSTVESNGNHFLLNIANFTFGNAIRDMWLQLPRRYYQFFSTNSSSKLIFECVSKKMHFFTGSLLLDEFSPCYDSGNISSGVGSVVDNLSYPWTHLESKATSGVYGWSFLFVLIFIMAGGLGNILVCLAICLDKRLQNVTNYFLLSLAIADLLVSLFVMPMGAIPGFLGRWPLSAAWCNVYVTCDVLACSSSIMHMCFISVGRYLGIRNPLKTRHRATKRLVAIKIALVWLLSMLVSSSITVLGLMDSANIMPDSQSCSINHRWFWVLGSLVAFYIPMVMMVVSYVLTVQLLGRQAKLAGAPVSGAHRRLCGGMDGGVGVGGLFRSTSRENHNDFSRDLTWRIVNTNRSQRVGNNLMQSLSQPQLSFVENGNGCGERVRCGDRRTRRDQATQTPRSVAAVTRRLALNPLKLPTITPNALGFRFLAGRRKGRAMSANAVANEQKATKVLGIVFFTFVLCWAPFFLLNIIFAACPHCHVSNHVVEVCLWLGYVSSTINPVIYTAFNRTFRAAFFRLLCCRCHRWSRGGRYTSVRAGGVGAAGGASALCARSALPLAISLRAARTSTSSPATLATPVTPGDTSETVLIEHPL